MCIMISIWKNLCCDIFDVEYDRVVFPVYAECAMASQKILEEQLDPSYEPTAEGKIFE